MKLFPKAALVAAILASSAAHAAELNEIEKGYIWFDVATTVVKNSCGAHEIPGGVLKMGDRNGIDVNLYAHAISAAAAAAIGFPYNRSDLIPGVTQVYRLAQHTISGDLEQNKTKTCGNWIVILREAGTVE
jgi:hypothetical protein